MIVRAHTSIQSIYEDSRDYNAPQQIIKGISHCYDKECRSTNIHYDEFRDEIVCKTCGSVLRQGLNDYEYLFTEEDCDDFIKMSN